MTKSPTKKKQAANKSTARPRNFKKGTLKQVGILTLAKNDDTNGFYLLRQRLKTLKHTEGKDISLHFGFANGDNSKLSALATELLQIPVEVLVTCGTRALQEVLALTRPPKLSIVQAVGGEDPDPDAAGFFLDVVSMCTDQLNELRQKNITELTILHDSSSQSKNEEDPYTAVVHAASGLTLNPIDISKIDDLAPSDVFVGQNTVIGGFMLIPNGWFFDHYQTIGQTVDIAMQNYSNAWAIYPEAEYFSAHTNATQDRVIVSGHDIAQAYTDTADIIDTILGGKKPPKAKGANKIHS